MIKNKTMKTHLKVYPSIIWVAVATLVLLLIPLVAMQFSPEVRWSASDFIVAGTLLFGTGLAYLLISKRGGRPAYRIATAVALFSGLLLIWANGAVGIIGSENNKINLWYFGVIAVGIAGAFIARFQAKGMAITLLVMAGVQAIIAAMAMITGMAGAPDSPAAEILTVNGFFILLFGFSAGLFRFAAGRSPASPATHFSDKP